MKLRQWQEECVELALQKYSSQTHFLCQATPGAGKSMMAAELAVRLYRAGKVDFILCFSPSVSIASGLAQTFSTRFGLPFDGKLGAVGGLIPINQCRTKITNFGPSSIATKSLWYLMKSIIALVQFWVMPTSGGRKSWRKSKTGQHTP
ncbi:DEAD/DEAH box helicase family protein [Shewanella algae]|uniref:DEAD/DEAH box helicase family protein n=1 Tax=Shewanella algae TaxID=38313 RepID=UPI0012DD437A|nr:DEAD/DEAH box helicase family protein [Shewanella algae]QGS61889.1 hypothetical protein GMX02_21630 [Shewanella algae]